jgi:hypothetical protein
VGQYITDDRILSILHELYKKLGRRPFKADVDQDGRVGFSTIVSRFGGIQNALEKAGIPFKKRGSHKKAECLDAIYETVIEFGSVPTRAFYASLNRQPSAVIISTKFGGWSKAIMAAGFKENIGRSGKGWRSWEKLCEEIAIHLYGKSQVKLQHKYRGSYESIDIFVPKYSLGIDAKTSAYDIESSIEKQSKRMLRSKDFKRIEFWCLRRGAGAFKNKKVRFIYAEELKQKVQLLKKAGYQKIIKLIDQAIQDEDEYRASYGGITSKELKDELLAFKQKNGRLPTQIELKPRNGMRSASTYVKLFGGLANAFMAIGEPPGKGYWSSLTDEELKGLFLEYVDQFFNGETPPSQHFANENSLLPSLSVYSARKGSYNSWLKYCGLEVNEEYEINLSDRQALAFLKRAYKSYGKPLAGRREKEWRKYEPEMPSQSWYRKRYGTWNNALKAAGLPVKEEFKKPTLSKKIHRRVAPAASAPKSCIKLRKLA